MLVHSQGIVLRTVDYQNSSIIATVLSKEKGKIALLAKGAKKPKNKLIGKLSVGNMIDFVCYFKDSRSVQLVKEADYAEKNFKISSDLHKTAIATMTIEQVNQLVQDGEENAMIYSFLETFLIWLNETHADPTQIFAYNQVRLAHIMGVGLTLEDALKKPSQHNKSYLNIKDGTITNEAQSDVSLKLTPKQTLYLKLALLTKSNKILSLDLPKHEYKLLIRHLDSYFNYHFHEIKPRKSDFIFDQLM